MGQLRPTLRFIFGLLKKQDNFYIKSMWKNVHPVYSEGIRTHDLSNMSHH